MTLNGGYKMYRNIEKQNELINKLVKTEIEASGSHMNIITVYAVKSNRKNTKCNDKHFQTFHGTGKNEKKEFTEDNKRDLIDFVINNEYDFFRITVYNGGLSLSIWDAYLLGKEDIIEKVIQYMDMLNRLEKN